MADSNGKHAVSHRPSPCLHTLTDAQSTDGVRDSGLSFTVLTTSYGVKLQLPAGLMQLAANSLVSYTSRIQHPERMNATQVRQRMINNEVLTKGGEMEGSMLLCSCVVVHYHSIIVVEDGEREREWGREKGKEGAVIYACRIGCYLAQDECCIHYQPSLSDEGFIL